MIRTRSKANLRYRLLKTIFFILILVLALVLGRKVSNELIYRLPFSVPGLPACPDCNIILVSIDTLRADDLPCYGYSRDTAPNLCAFAKNNILFSKFYSQSSFTLDSHMSIFTGLYPTTHQVLYALKDNLSPAIPTLTETLQKNGYQTIYAGITDDPNLPLDKGLERGFAQIQKIDIMDQGWQDSYQNLLSKFLGNKPTFLFLHTYAVHDPYLPGRGPRLYTSNIFPNVPLTRNEFEVNALPFYQFVRSEFQRRLAASATLESQTRNSTIVRDLSAAINNGDTDASRRVFWTMPQYEQYELYDAWYWRQIDRTNPTMIAYLRSLYDERINQLDKNLEPLLAFVSRPEVKRKTIVIFTADHGEEFMEHGQVTHDNNIYNTATHVPFIMAAPRLKGGFYENLAQSIDIYPTLLDLVGIKSQAPLEGKSLLPTLQGNAGIGEYLVSEHRGDVIKSIQDGSWKLYLYNLPRAQPWKQLYDLSVDPEEKNNVALSRPEIVTRLSAALRNILNASPKYEPVRGEFPGWIDEEKRQKLIEHGYF